MSNPRLDFTSILRQALLLYVEGHQQTAVAAKLGLTQTAVSKSLHLHGLKHSSVVRRIRAGESPQQIFATATAEQPALPLEVSEVVQLRQRNAFLEGQVDMLLTNNQRRGKAFRRILARLDALKAEVAEMVHEEPQEVLCA